MTLTNLPKNKKAILLKRPENEITDDLFKIIDEECIEPNDDELLIRVDTIAIDAWIRTTFDEGSYHDTSQLNQVIGALGIGEVLISKSDKFKEGDFVSGPMGVQTHIEIQRWPEIQYIIRFPFPFLLIPFGSSDSRLGVKY